MTGNEAIAEGAIQAGCTFYAGYPITPQNELTAYMANHMQNRGGVFIQAEAETAAINMVYGAAAAGARAITSSSSPGISLKQEGISYLAGAELPSVIVNIMRGGPGLGNIAPAQSDYFQATRSGGHGDYHCLVLAPSTVQECYDLTGLAFELADKYRIPAIILGDGLLGQMMEPLIIKPGAWSPELGAKKDWTLTGCKGRKANVVKSFYLKEGDLEKFNLKLQNKYKKIQQEEERWEELLLNDAKVILVAYGSMARIVKGAVKALREKGKRVGLIRPISLWPFPKQAFSKLHAPRSLPVRQAGKLLVIEMSYGQMLEDVQLVINGRAEVEFLGRAAGGVPSEEEIIAKVNKIYNG